MDSLPLSELRNAYVRPLGLLGEKDEVGVFNFKAGPYVILGKLKDRKWRWVPISADMWETVKASHRDILQALEKGEVKEFFTKENQALRTVEFCYKMYVCLARFDEKGKTIPWSTINLTLEAWRDLKDFVNAVDQKLLDSCSEGSTSKTAVDRNPKRPLPLAYQWMLETQEGYRVPN